MRQITTQLALNNLVIFNGTTFYPTLKSRNVSRDLFLPIFFSSSSRYSSPLKCLVLFIVLLNCCFYYTKFYPIFKSLNVSRDLISFSFHFLFFFYSSGYSFLLEYLVPFIVLLNHLIFNHTKFYPIFKSLNVSRDLDLFFAIFFSSSGLYIQNLFLL